MFFLTKLFPFLLVWTYLIYRFANLSSFFHCRYLVVLVDNFCSLFESYLITTTAHCSDASTLRITDALFKLKRSKVDFRSYSPTSLPLILHVRIFTFITNFVAFSVVNVTLSSFLLSITFVYVERYLLNSCNYTNPIDYLFHLFGKTLSQAQ
ncbi:hypothetical protein EDC96DRAFT_542232 [Choanephora cucurbitarum]|nr:hypothetical protein EDC96DRAFT_542232 [Choanephora cucurbitarum]